MTSLGVIRAAGAARLADRDERTGDDTPPPRPASSASLTPSSIASSSRGSTLTRSSPKISTAMAASSSAGRQRGEEFCVTTMLSSDRLEQLEHPGDVLVAEDRHHADELRRT